MNHKIDEQIESKIKILLVEDIPSDSELVQHEIRKTGIDCVFQTVDNKQDFLEALHRNIPDVILSDYMLPEFSGMEALRLTKEFDPSIPFIIVTGSMNEETAVICMKAGADDYVIKEHIAAVTPAVKDAIEKKRLKIEKKKAEESLRKSEEQFRLIMESIVEMIIVLDVDGNLTYVSPSYIDIFGDPKLLHDSEPFHRVHPEEKEKIKKIFFETIKTGKGQLAEYRILGKDGNLYYLESQGSAIKDSEGRVINVVVVSRDITQRKKDEKMLREKEEFLNNIIENIPDMIYIKDAKDLRFVRLNKACELEWGYKREELIGKNDYDFFSKNEADFYSSKDKEVLTKKQMVRIPEESVQTKFIGKRILQTKKIPILNQEGVPQFLLGISEDITVRKEEEEELRSKTTFLETLLNSSNDGILVVDSKGKKILHNQRLIELTNIPVNLVNENNYKNQFQYLMYQTKDPEKFIEKIGYLHNNPSEVSLDEIEFKNGIILERYSAPVIGRDGKYYGRIWSFRDITKHRKAEEALVREQYLMNMLMDNIPDDIYFKDTDSRFIRLNKAQAKRFGLSNPVQAVGKTDFDFFTEEHARPAFENEQTIIRTGKSFVGIEEIETWPDGRETWVSTTKMPLHDKEGNIIGTFGISRDITEHKQAEIFLLESKAKLTEALQIAKLGTWEYDVALDQFTFTDQFYTLFHTTAEQEGGYKMSSARYAQKFVYPDDSTLVGAEIKKSLETTDPNYYSRLDHRIVCADGEVGYITVHIRVEKDADGRTVKTRGVNQDITERKRAEEALVQEQYLMNMLMDNIPDYIYFKDTDSRFIRMNMEHAKKFGLSNPIQAIGKTDFDFYPRELAEQYHADEQAIIQSGQPLINREEPSLDAAGNPIWNLTTKVPLRDQQGRIVGLVGTSRDITERKRIEKVLATERNLLRTLIDNLPDHIYAKDAEGRFTMCNTGEMRHHGASTTSELIGKTDFDFYSRELAEKYHADEQAIILAGQPMINSEEPSLDAVGNPMWISTTKVPLCDQQGRIVGLVGMSRDITERKRMEEALKESEQRFRSFFESSPDAIVLIDPSGCWPIVDCNDTACHMNGYTREELIGKSIDILNISEGTPEERDDYLKSIKRGEGVMHIETFHRHRDGHIFPVEVSTSIITFKGHELVLGIDRDITERKQAEEELQKSEEKYRSIFENIQDIYYETLLDGTILEVSPSIEILSKGQYNRNDLIGKSMNEFYVDTKLRNNFLSVLQKTGSVTDFEIVLKNRDGSHIPCSISSKLSFDKQGKPVKLSGSMRDISERKQADKALSESEERMRDIIFSMGDWVWEVDENGRYTYSSEKIQNILGHTPEDIIGKTPFDFMPSDEAERVKTIFSKIVMNKSNIKDLENWNIGKNGERICLLTNGVPILDENGNLKGYRGVDKNITDRKHAEEALVREQYLMNMLMDNVPDHIYFKDKDSRFIRINMDCAKKFGLSNPTQAIGKTDFDFFTEEHARPAFEDEQKIIRTGKPIVGIEEKETWPDGHETWASTTKMPLCDKEGNIIGTFGVSRDITERKHAEEQINLLAHTIRSVSECVSITDLNDIILFVNDAFLTTYGYSEHEILGKNIKIVRSQNNPPDLAVDVYDKARDSGWQGELLNKTKDGREFPTYLSTSVVRDFQGKAVALVGVASDITERKQAEKALRESEERYRFIVEATSDVIYQIRYNSAEYEYINPTIEKLTGYTPEEINSMGFSNIIEKVKKLSDEKVKVRVTHGKVETDEWRTDYQIKTKAGNLIWISDTSYPWVDENGETVGRIGIMRDITDRIRAQEEIVKAKERAEEMNRLKSNFLANMSHELRTPLIGIMGFADILKDESKGKEQKEIAETILQSGNRLSETLNLILDLSKVEAETLKINTEEVELNDFMRTQFNSFNKSLIKKGVKLKLNLSKEPIFSILDKILLNSIFNNLLNNAIKYTNKGEVVIGVKKIVEKSEEFAEIFVKDTGIGISKENLDIIFEPFRQVSEGYTRKFEGTGLGLTLVKKYVKNMNGEISVESDVGVGSEFRVRFPAVKTPLRKMLKPELQKNIEETEIDKNVFKRPVILIVDDDPVTRRVVSRFIENCCDVDKVSNGEEALKYVENKKYDLILMDIYLGRGLSGLDTVSKIKKVPGYKDIPIVAVTAYALAGDKEKFIEKGCSSYLSKPFTKNDLVSLMSQVLKFKLIK